MPSLLYVAAVWRSRVTFEKNEATFSIPAFLAQCSVTYMNDACFAAYYDIRIRSLSFTRSAYT